MDWSSENYVRLYIRDTAEWLQVTPCARWFFWDLLRRVDRRGQIALGQMGLKALCALVHAPWKTVRPLIAELIQDGCVQCNADRSVLTVRNYVPAQTAKWENKHLCKRARQKAKETAMDLPKAAPDIHQALPSELRRPQNHRSLHSSNGARMVPLDLGDPSNVPNVGLDIDISDPHDGTYGQRVIDRVTDMPSVTSDMPHVDRDMPSVDLTDKTDRQTETLRVEDHAGLKSRGVRFEESVGDDQGSSGREDRKPVKTKTPKPEPAVAADPGAQLGIPGIAKPRTERERIREEAHEVWDHYMLRWTRNFPRATHKPAPEAKRFALIGRMLGYFTKEQLIAAIDAMWDNPWRVQGGYYQLEAAIQDAGRVERLLAEAENPTLRDRDRDSRNVVRLEKPRAPVQSAPPGHQGYRASLHFTDDGTFDSEGRLLDDEEVRRRIAGDRGRA